MKRRSIAATVRNSDNRVNGGCIDKVPAVMPTIEQGKLRQAYQTSRGCFVGNLQEQLNFKDESSSEIRVQGTIGTEASDDTRFGGRESGEALAQAEGGRSNQI